MKPATDGRCCRARAWLLLALVWGVVCGASGEARAVPPDTAFWVWNRAEPLTLAEHDALRAAGARGPLRAAGPALAHFPLGS